MLQEECIFCIISELLYKFFLVEVRVLSDGFVMQLFLDLFNDWLDAIVEDVEISVRFSDEIGEQGRAWNGLLF